MSKQAPIDDPKSSSLNAFQLIAIGFLFGSSLSILDWIVYRTIQDLFLLVDTIPITTLWLTNILTTTVHLMIILPIYFSLRRKLTTQTLDWKKLLDQSKYVFSFTILANIFIQVYWDYLLPPYFFSYLEVFNIIAGESLIYVVLPILFAIVDVVVVLILLKRLSDKIDE